ncbi:hypothetical protein BEL04_05645 [Mucilaginibacter sp. PPCGB 2223]|uniref:DUF3810 domain-containing protein n=1 Tax=Mucilaginibacter sp. PPCGB 2223 TaxID=1886027 RepID=UPI000826EA84|nr:DUF3810 domain-containing protein [Mucilaginibacter sp. PPCGB 2223]OCX53770.1 hypothetical protein BEL04_05645 [Mucilaginibacter sp. PPCGB 2223]
MFRVARQYRLKFKVIGILTILIIILSVITWFPGFIEYFYSQGLYLFICHILHPVFNIFPFSIGDVFYVGLIIYCICALVRIIRYLFKKRWQQLAQLLLGLVIVVQVIYAAFYLFWGLNYFRPSAAERLNLQDTSYTLTDVKAVAQMLIDSMNASKAALKSVDTLQSNREIYNTAASAVADMSGRSKNFPAIHPGVKSSLLSWLLNYLETSGYYDPFTSEAQINYQMPVFLKPFVACHEMSHQMGFGAEDEADFAGYVTGISSRDRFLRYSAYFEGTAEFMHAIYRRDTVMFKELKTHISKPVLADFKKERLYWKSFEGKAGSLSGIFYDHFLKANNQPHGIKTYNRMIRLCMAWYRKKDRRL